MNNGSVRGFQRHRYPILERNAKGDFVPNYPDRNRESAVIALNKLARAKAVEAYGRVRRLFAKHGIMSPIDAFAKGGEALAAYFEGLNVAGKHGFSPFGSPTYKHLHPTKGYRKVPA